MTFSTLNNNERKPITDLQERVWLSFFRKGDMVAFERIVHTHQKSIFSYLKRCQFSQQECEFLFQDIVHDIYSKADSYTLSSPLLPWIFQIVVTSVRQFQHGDKIGYFFPVEDIPILHTLKSQPTISERDIQQFNFTLWLNNCLCDLLPTIQVEILLLTTLQIFDLDDIAVILGIPHHKTIAYLHQARHTILTHWADHHHGLVMKKTNIKKMDYV